MLICDGVIKPEHLRAARVSCTQLRPLELSGPAVDRVLDGEWSLRDITRECVRQIESTLIGAVLEQTGGNKSKAARLLNVDYKTLFYKAKDLGY